MLKQILRDMYVDPEILAGLDETYKQTLFCKMREEQVRRWRIWDEKQHQLETTKANNPKKSTRHINFRVGDDGEPWVWVMGEHPDDQSIEDILEREAKDKARQLAEKEIRKSVEAQLSDIIEFDSKKNKINEVDIIESPKIEDMEIYCSVDELKERMKPQIPPHISEIQNNVYNSRFNGTSNNRINSKIEVLQEISYNKPKPAAKIAARIAQWEQLVIGQRTSEIFQQIQQKKQETVKEAEEAARKVDEHWREQERRAKQAEVQMREIARRAREEHRKSIMDDNSNSSSPATSLDISVPRPPNQDAVIQWYRNSEFPKKTGIDETGMPEKWFHGLLHRTEAETQLANEEPGTFLVRISEKIWGYAISYKDVDRYKHYLVDASNGKYQFLGQNQLVHNSLCDLLKYHSTVPITILGNELLLRSCSNNGHTPAVLDGLV